MLDSKSFQYLPIEFSHAPCIGGSCAKTIDDTYSFKVSKLMSLLPAFFLDREGKALKCTFQCIDDVFFLKFGERKSSSLILG